MVRFTNFCLFLVYLIAQKVDELRIGGPKKKLMPSLWGEDGEKKAMKENLHCVESHEAESALFFWDHKSGGHGSTSHRFRIKKKL